MKYHCEYKITTLPGDLEEGLFGQVLLWVFEVLPYLHDRGLRPSWAIRSSLYGQGDDALVLPGVFDLAYDLPPSSSRWPERSLLDVRSRQLSVLGNDWSGLRDIWCTYFKVPKRIEAQADGVGLPHGTLGLHYRGTDKNLASQDTNPVSKQDMLDLASEALERHADLATIFVASDEPGFADAVATRFGHLKVINLGDVSFHKGPMREIDRADRALLDCVLLSRCRLVLKCSSALSGFAKVLQPDLEIYRVAACKLFTDVPYFPDAYIPRWHTDSTAGLVRQARLFDGDWLDDPRVSARFRRDFRSQARYGPVSQALRRLKYLLT